MAVGPAGVARPIILLGAARSGTTALCHALMAHPDLAIWEEPKHIWRYGNAYRRDDRLVAADASSRIARYIRNSFARFRDRLGRSRFAEKTPSNCFRVPFIQAVFPDALFVHVVRDGRAVAASAMQQWRHDFVGRFDTAYAFNSSFQERSTEGRPADRLRSALQTSRKFITEKQRFAGGLAVFAEAPAYVPDLMRVFRRKMAAGKRSFVWGPKFPGIFDFHRSYSLAETCAQQWLLSVKTVRADARALPADQFLELQFEDIVGAPADAYRSILEFAGLSRDDAAEASAVGILGRRSSRRWDADLVADEARAIEEWLAPMLDALGYADTGPAEPHAAVNRNVRDGVPL